MKVGIKAKLIGFIALLLGVVIFLLSFLVLGGIRTYQDNNVKKTLKEQKDMFEDYFSEEYDKEENVEGSLEKVFNKSWLRTIPANLYDPDGNLLFSFKSSGALNENEDRDKMINYAKQDKMSYKKSNSSYYYYSPIKYDNDVIGIVELQYSNEENILFYNNIRNLFAIVGCFSVIIGIIIEVLYFSRFIKDIYKIKDAVENIQKEKFCKGHILLRKDELGDLSTGIVSMSKTIEKNIKDLKIERDYLSKAVDKLEKMDNQQKEFLGNVTHEFKTPITAIKAYSDVMGMYKEDVNLIEEGTNNISNECDRLTDLVDKVLSLSALEKYDFEINKGNVNIRELFTEISNTMSGKIKKNNLKFEFEAEDIILYIDKESLKHIFINLIDNAIKYNKENGFIKVNAYKNQNMAVVEIIDSGVGISKEYINKIFDPFYRIDHHRSHETGGTGLGLSLVKKLIEKIGGSISVESELNKGSTFCVNLPL